MKKFLPWLIPITLLLAAVPVLLVSERAGLAKAVGITVVVLTSVALRFWLYNAGKLRKRSERVVFTINERYFLESAWPYYKVMPKPDKGRLEERAGLLLAGLSFDNYDHTEPSRESCLVFSVVLANLVSAGTFHHPVNGIVVFREGDSEIMTQEQSRVLFVDEDELRQVLAVLSGGELRGVMRPETTGKLLEFYAG